MWKSESLVEHYMYDVPLFRCNKPPMFSHFCVLPDGHLGQCMFKFENIKERWLVSAATLVGITPHEDNLEP